MGSNMIPRRPPTTHVVAAAVILAFLFYTFHLVGRRGIPLPAAGSHFGGGGGSVDYHVVSLMDDINNNTLGFERIFVVGMPSRTDRRDGISLQAALGNLEVEFIDSTDDTSVSDKAIPTIDDHERLANPVIGSWRGHIDAIREVVRRNLTSALIMEDDVDWDIRIRQQLQRFAQASRALTQPLLGWKDVYADPTYPLADRATNQTWQFDLDSVPKTVEPQRSPYGDDWDVLWLGQCGQMFPRPEDKNVPKGRAVQHNDETVAQKRYLRSVLEPFEYAEQYPDHTRVVHHVQDGACSLAYAVSQRGARAMLNEIGLGNLNAAFDLLLHWSCSGEFGRGYHRCLTVQAGLFQHHRPAGRKSKDSDISAHGDELREKAMTEEIRWSVRLNADTLLEGRDNFVDQYPDVVD
ncbi:glycosyltransferase family 25 protein [Coniochaeta sp. 2T2.1]|nr:glycosyltransferase family 25 protein [Coniochaeta sp. 2T2.1]